MGSLRATCLRLAPCALGHIPVILKNNKFKYKPRMFKYIDVNSPHALDFDCSHCLSQGKINKTKPLL